MDSSTAWALIVIELLPIFCPDGDPFISGVYNIWHTGSSDGLDFNQIQTIESLAGYPSTFTDLRQTSNMSQIEGDATFCDSSSREVIIYSDGEKSWVKMEMNIPLPNSQNYFNTAFSRLYSAVGAP